MSAQGQTAGTILVAIDSSEGAGRAVDYAARMAKVFGVEFLIVNVIGHTFPEELFKRFTDAQQKWVEEMLESLSAGTLTAARERAARIGATAIRLECRTGEIARTIIDITKEQSVASIVVGKRGTGQLAGLLLGSVSHKLVSLAPFPVTVVP